MIFVIFAKSTNICMNVVEKENFLAYYARQDINLSGLLYKARLMDDKMNTSGNKKEQVNLLKIR